MMIVPQEPDFEGIKRKELEKFFRSLDHLKEEDLDILLGMINSSDTPDYQKGFAGKILEERKELMGMDWEKGLKAL